jgi:copper chaperone CopZ
VDKQTFRISDMHCVNCALRIESLEDELPGVKRISVSYHKGLMDIEYDPAQLGPAAIITAVHRLGYTAVRLN